MCWDLKNKKIKKIKKKDKNLGCVHTKYVTYDENFK